MEVVLQWTHNGAEVMQREDIMFTPTILNHNLNIRITMESDSGVYVCRAALEEDDIPVEQSINVTVVPGIVFIHCALHNHNHTYIPVKPYFKEF